jgi:hypothetical protein
MESIGVFGLDSALFVDERRLDRQRRSPIVAAINASTQTAAWIIVVGPCSRSAHGEVTAVMALHVSPPLSSKSNNIHAEQHRAGVLMEDVMGIVIENGGSVQTGGTTAG